MQDEAEEPNTESKGPISNGPKPTRAEMLLLAAAWALLVITLVAGFRLWSGGSH